MVKLSSRPKFVSWVFNSWQEVMLYMMFSSYWMLWNLRWRSLEIIGNSTVRKLWYCFLFAFHSNYGHIFGRFYTIQERDRQTSLQPPDDSKGRIYA